MAAVEELQQQVWPGSATDVVPAHLLVTAAQNGGLVLGAYQQEQLVGFVFGFPGLYAAGEAMATKHCSHMLGVLPAARDDGVGFALKRAQWQLVRHQKLELITWTYDPLESRNGFFNITKLGAVASTYKREFYGQMRDGLNAGLASDRLQVDWWVNSPRVRTRMARRPRRKLDLAHYFQAGAEIANPTKLTGAGLPGPQSPPEAPPWAADLHERPRLVLIEIPSDFQSLKRADAALAQVWRTHTRELLENLFSTGYLITDFVYLSSTQARSFYILSDGNSTLGA